MSITLTMLTVGHLVSWFLPKYPRPETLWGFCWISWLPVWSNSLFSYLLTLYYARSSLGALWLAVYSVWTGLIGWTVSRLTVVLRVMKWMSGPTIGHTLCQWRMFWNTHHFCDSVTDASALLVTPIAHWNGLDQAGFEAVLSDLR